MSDTSTNPFTQIDSMRMEMHRLQARCQEIETLLQKTRELGWLCKTCNTVFPITSLRPGPTCLVCPGCGKATIRPVSAWKIEEQAAYISRLEAAYLKEVRGNALFNGLCLPGCSECQQFADQKAREALEAIRDG